MVFGLYCLLAPVICMFLVLFYPLYILFPDVADKLGWIFDPPHRELDPDDSNTETLFELDPEAILSDGTDASPKAAADLSYKPSLFDPCALRHQEMWKARLTEQIPKHFSSELAHDKLGIAVLVLFCAVGIAIMVLDVRRELLVHHELQRRHRILIHLLDTLWSMHWNQESNSIRRDSVHLKALLISM
jgi:hypothetical protein